jgi:hypothetical protein
MNLKPKFWNADKIVSFSAILISLATMGVYIYQTHLIQKQQHATVMPYLRMGYSYDSDRFDFIIYNEGVGPAFIEEVNIYYDGKKYKDMDISDFMLEEYYKKDIALSSGLSYANVNKNGLFAAGKNRTLLSCQKSVEKTHKLQDLFFKEKVRMEVIYSSLYGEKWIVSKVDERPKKLED